MILLRRLISSLQVLLSLFISSCIPLAARTTKILLPRRAWSSISASSTSLSCVMLCKTVATWLVLLSMPSSAVVIAHSVEDSTMEEGGEDHHAVTEESSSSDEFSQTDVTIIICLVWILIALTILFEYVKEALEESVSKHMKKVVEKLFGELTILGFLAMCTFFFQQSGTIKKISEYVGEEEEELFEYLESVHYTIFFIMVFFVAQVIMLMREAKDTDSMWFSFDRECYERDRAAGGLESAESICTPSVEQVAAARRLGRTFWLRRILPFWKDDKTERLHEVAVFAALRREFILDRSPIEPFSEAEKSQQLDSEFLFGRYLALAQTYGLVHVVEVKVNTWLSFAGATLLWFAVASAVHESIQILAWSWIFFGWVVMIFNIFLERHLLNLRKMFLPKKLAAALYESTENSTSASGPMEETGLLESPLEDNLLPGWCHWSFEQYQSTFKYWIGSKLLGDKSSPNRQQALYWMHHKAPFFYRWILQWNLVFVGVYGAILLLAFCPVLWSVYSWWMFLISMAIAVAPIFKINGNQQRIVATLVQVCSLGSYRKFQVIRDVLREQKTRHLVRTFLVIAKMRRFASGEHGGGHHGNGNRGTLVRASRSFRSLEIAQVGKTFDAFDTDHSGDITGEEFKELLSRMSIGLSVEQIENVVQRLDADKDGNVTRAEFLEWYTQSMDSTDEGATVHERAHELFNMFDQNGSGEITIGEFKHKLDAMQMGLTVDEVGAIVNELDHDHNGTVSLEEFEHMMEKYYPQELVSISPSNVGHHH